LSSWHFDNSLSIPTYPTCPGLFDFALTSQMQKQVYVTHDYAPAVYTNCRIILFSDAPNSPPEQVLCNVISKTIPASTFKSLAPALTIHQPVTSFHWSNIPSLFGVAEYPFSRQLRIEFAQSICDKHLGGQVRSGCGWRCWAYFKDV